jgi:hypothetical protein
MFRILVLQTLYTLSDDQAEYQLRDRLSFMRFAGLALHDPVPDAKTIWLFREQLVRNGALTKLFERLDRLLHERGYPAMGGQIVVMADDADTALALADGETRPARDDLRSLYMISPGHHAAIVWFLRTKGGVPSATIQVWNLMLDNLDPATGEVNATRIDIAESLGINPTSVSTAISTLVKGGFIRIERAPRTGRRGSSSRYFLEPTAGHDLPAAPVGWDVYERRMPVRTAPRRRRVSCRILAPISEPVSE